MAPSSEPSYPTGLVWFRRDLRATDHAALFRALTQCQQVHCAFVFDHEILNPLARTDRRVEFIRESLQELDGVLRTLSAHPRGGLIVLHAVATEAVPALAHSLGAQAVFANHDDEPQALARDSLVRTRLATAGRAFHTFKDHTILERSEVLTQTGNPYSVFTPYKNAWLKKLDDFNVRSYAVEKCAAHLASKPAGETLPGLAEIGFAPTNLAELNMPVGMSGGRRLFDDFTARIERYKRARDFPAVKGVSYLSTHLRFGTVSIRQLAAHARARGGEGAETWLSELIWRDFYHQILWHHPQVVERAFRPEYDAVKWDDAPELFAAWCEARTGYPNVDAAMRQLNQTGYMHNRLRMIVASFLTKDLGVDWRLGERYFAVHLNDYDLAANNGGWQWAASTGCDAQPWFRIFNPVTQSEKFDPEGRFIRRYLPELARVPDKFIHAPWTMGGIDQTACRTKIGVDYPGPIVDHAAARERTLQRFGVVKNDAQGG